jgi:formiminotetrahydrofolate cyclodeaminase
MIAEQSVRSLCDELAARTPAPGGGATAAVAGALGAAQLLMVAEYAAWTQDDPRPGLRDAYESLIRLADEDAEAYAAYRSAPKVDGRAKARIAAVPLAVDAAAARALEAVESVRSAAKPWFAADIAIAEACLRACVLGARLLAEANA